MVNNDKWESNYYELAKRIVENKENINVDEKSSNAVKRQLVGLSETLISLYEQKHEKDT